MNTQISVTILYFINNHQRKKKIHSEKYKTQKILKIL